MAVVIAGVLDRAGAKTPVLVLARRVPQSVEITRADLTTVAVAGDVSTISADQVDQVVGRHAAYTLEAGAILQPQALLASGAVDESQASVGIAVPVSLAPDGLEPGDRVRVLQIPDAENASGATGMSAGASVLADGALITSVSKDPSQSSGLVLTLRVATGAAGQLLMASSRAQVGLVQVGS